VNDADLRDPTRGPGSWRWLGLLAYMLFVGVYFLARFQGYWAEADSSSFARYTRDVIGQGRLIPGAEIYPNGYLDQTVSAFIVNVTGVQVATLQQWVYPFLAAIAVPAAWMAYRSLTGSLLGATVASALLFINPEFLFVILRSSHEKFTRMLMLVCLFLLAEMVVRARERPRRQLVVLAVLFWFTSYAMIASNLLLAASFFLALATSVVLGWPISRIRSHLRPVQRPLTRLLPVLLAGSIALMALFVLVVYPPAAHNVAVLRDTVDQIAALFRGSTEQSSDVLGAYSYVNLSWIDLRVYFLLSIADWALLFGSAAVWVWLGWRWLIRGDAPVHATAWLVWLLYVAFVLQGAVSIVSDASGAFGSNIEVRLFPSFAMVAVAVVGVGIAPWRPPAVHRPLASALAAGVFCVSILSMLKVTNEPLFSNKWNFYRPSEVVALEWGDDHLAGATVWTEFDERLIAAVHTLFPSLRNSYVSSITMVTRDMLVTSVTRARATRIDRPLPVPPDAWQIYDNGEAQFYHARPETPYQP
jgi:hypothetical protein